MRGDGEDESEMRKLPKSGDDWGSQADSGSRVMVLTVEKRQSRAEWPASPQLTHSTFCSASFCCVGYGCLAHRSVASRQSFTGVGAIATDETDEADEIEEAREEREEASEIIDSGEEAREPDGGPPASCQPLALGTEHHWSKVERCIEAF